MLTFIKWTVIYTYLVEGKSSSMTSSNDNMFFFSYVNEYNSIKPFSYISSVWDIKSEHVYNKYLSSA